MLKVLAISNYRSLRNLVIPLGSLNLITRPNGSGKSNVYRALRLLADTANGGVIASLAREGGISSTLWAGPESFSGAVKRGERPVEPTRERPKSIGRARFRRRVNKKRHPYGLWLAPSRQPATQHRHTAEEQRESGEC